jgi:mannose-6-phosphate isomerase-like protein (cupin superfamily)
VSVGAAALPSGAADLLGPPWLVALMERSRLWRSKSGGGSVETRITSASTRDPPTAQTDCLHGFRALLVHGGHDGLNRFVGDTTITKVDSTHSPRGPLGQTYLATGVGVGMRLWRDRPPGEPKPQTARDYETVGYVISGRAELHSEGQMVLLGPGDCWVVPRHASHTYKILESFTAIEATHPPAEIHDRDHPVSQ